MIIIEIDNCARFYERFPKTVDSMDGTLYHETQRTCKANTGQLNVPRAPLEIGEPVEPQTQHLPNSISSGLSSTRNHRTSSWLMNKVAIVRCELGEQRMTRGRCVSASCLACGPKNANHPLEITAAAAMDMLPHKHHPPAIRNHHRSRT